MRTYRRFGPYLVLVSAWALFFWRFAAPNPADRLTYPPGDFSQQFGVFRDIAYQALASGHLPLWADCLYSGYPFHADPQAQLFYPPIWLIFAYLRLQGWGNFPIAALVAEAALHYLLASVFTYVFLRSLRLRPAAALLGAIVFAYGGYLTGSPPVQTGILETAIWLPLTLLCARRLAERRRTRDLALAALALAVAFLAGHPQTFYYVAGLSLAYFALRARQAGWRWAPLGGYAAALGALAGALAAVQLLPSADFILHSTRASVPFDMAGAGFPFTDVLQVLVTGLVSYWQPLYVGLLSLGLAAFALTRRSAEVRFWGAAAVVGLVLSFGTRAVAYDAAYWLAPGYGLFRSQERLALVVSFALAVLAAQGADALSGPLSRRERAGLKPIVRAAGLVFLLTWLLLLGLNYALRLGLSGDLPGLIDHAGLLAFAAGLALLALAARARLPHFRRWLPALFVGVTILDLFAANRPVNVVRPYEPYPYNPLLDAVYADRGFFRVQDDFQLPGHAGCAYGYKSTDGVTPYTLATYARFVERVPELVRWKLLGVRYVVSWRADLFGQGDPPVVDEVLARGSLPDEKGNVTTVHRLGLEPQRAFLTHQVEPAPSADAAYARLAEPGFDPLTTALLPASVAVSAGSSTDQVAVVRESPGHLALSTTSSGAAVLVVSEAYFAGWRARVDGRPATVLMADGALLAVPVPAGAHQVELDYRPPLLAAGAIVSAAALLGTAALLWSRRRLWGMDGA